MNLLSIIENVLAKHNLYDYELAQNIFEKINKNESYVADIENSSELLLSQKLMWLEDGIFAEQQLDKDKSIVLSQIPDIANEISAEINFAINF